MTSFRCLLRFVLRLVIALAPAGVQALTVDSGDGSGDKAFYSSPAMVEGRPAITYTSYPLNPPYAPVKMTYVRATDATGSVWGPPVTVATGTLSLSQQSLLVANGNPAICYVDGASLKFVRAKDPTGDAWGDPVTLSTANGAYSAEIVDGKPAVCYSSSYIRAEDASGTTWGLPVTVYHVFLNEVVMKMVDGRPAICYSQSSVLRYVRASDAIGSQWYEEPVNVAPPQQVGNLRYPSMQVVNGRPAISYMDNLRGAVMYARATDAAGSAWSPPVRVGIPGAASLYPSLAVVSGKPAIGYYGIDGLDLRFDSRDLHYAQATDSDGTSWGLPVAVASTGDVGKNTALFIVNGSPALVYNDATLGTLKYTRAITDDTGTRWPPDLRVEQPAGTFVSSGGTKSYGVVAVGTTASFTFSLINANAGSMTLTNIGATIDGPNAAEFSVTAPPSATLAGGDSTAFTVRYAPVTPGPKTAVLHLTGSAEGTLHSYDITLTANSAPDMVVERPAGTALADGGAVSYPFPAQGTVTDLTFTVRNPGGADLTGLALTIDGPDATEFSVTAAPAPVVTPGGSTTFIVRHLMGPAGGKTTALHLTNNLPGSRNPFDLSIVASTGLPDQTFNPVPLSQYFCLAIQADGKSLAGSNSSIVRFLPDGSADAGFSPSFSGGRLIPCIAVQKDTKILVGGDFTSAGGRSRPGLARLNPDGSLDEAFAPAVASSVFCLAIQPDGKIIAAGGTWTSPQVDQPWLARFRPDGSRDESFNPVPDNWVSTIALQPDGKILIGGNFTKIGSTPASHIARLNTDGTPDAFAGGFSGHVSSLAVQPDGRILAAGGFPGKLARLFPSGLNDSSLKLTARYVNDLTFQTDGKCLVAGSIITEPDDLPHSFLARIHADGSLDDSFAPDVDGNEDDIWKLAVQADGRVIILGDFDRVGGFDHVYLARLENGAASSLLTASGGSTVRWLRSGTAPEVRDVTFDVKPSGSPDWTRLGTAYRIPGGWELSGLNLPATGSIRAQAYAGGSLMESITPILTPLESWRQQFFNTASNTGVAADDADPDRDGLTNFIEFAFGLSPVDRASHSLPEFKHNGDSFAATFTAPEGTGDILYTAESSLSMLPGTWTPIPDTGTAPAHVFSVPANTTRAFVRYAVTMR